MTNNNTQYTPGPWSINDENNYITVNDTSFNTVACFDYSRLTTEAPEPLENALNNARLIAAAPEMLIALEAVKKNYELTLQDIDDGTIDGQARHIHVHFLDKVTKVINKAKGWK